MKKWISTICFIFNLLFMYPLYKLLHLLIHDYYFKLYGSTELWNTYYNKVSSLQSVTFKIFIILFVLVYIWNIISFFNQIKYNNYKFQLKRTIILQSISLFFGFLLFIIAVLSSFVGLFNIFGAIIAIPILFLLVFIIIFFINLVGSMSGLCYEISLYKNNKISKYNLIINSILMFIPIINLTLCINLNKKS